MSNSEYISRDAVDTKLLAMEERFIDNPFVLTAIAMAINEIDKITAADVAPVVHGRWVKVKHPYGNVNWHKKCSICDKCIDWQDYKYCPVCGAKMDEEDEE